MSRIHEALRKIEEERAASQGAGVDSAPVGEMSVRTSLSVNPASVNPASVIPPLSSALTVDALLATASQCNWSPDPKTMLFFNPQEHIQGTEEFRTLRTRLYQLREKLPLKRLLVTSALPKEGKSFVAANLAQVMVRQHGRRALLIDADLRGPRLHLALGTTSAPGLSDYLLGESDEFAVMQRGSMDSLFFIPAGRNASNPAELVANGRLKLLLQRVEPLFDWIIMDSPPAVPVSDAGLLANFCDGTVMVVRSNSTPFDIARTARQEFAGKHWVGVVLNGIDAAASPIRAMTTVCTRRNGLLRIARGRS